MASSQIVVFDLPSRDPCKCWSPNSWKKLNGQVACSPIICPHLAEHYQVEYPDIKPRFQDHIQLKENQDLYTIPIVRFPNGEYVMDSLAIARRLEELYPNPSKPLQIDTPALIKWRELVRQHDDPMGPIYRPLVAQRVVSEGSQTYFHETRAKAFGMTVEEFKQLGPTTTADWERQRSFLQGLTAMLEENRGVVGEKKWGFPGETVSWMDFVWAAFLIFFKRIGDDVFEGFMGISGNREVHERLLEGVREWAERDDH